MELLHLVGAVPSQTNSLGKETGEAALPTARNSHVFPASLHLRGDIRVDAKKVSLGFPAAGPSQGPFAPPSVCKRLPQPHPVTSLLGTPNSGSLLLASPGRAVRSHKPEYASQPASTEWRVQGL